MIYFQLATFLAAQILVWAFAFALGRALGVSEGQKLGEKLGRARRNLELVDAQAEAQNPEKTEISTPLP